MMNAMAYEISEQFIMTKADFYRETCCHLCAWQTNRGLKPIDLLTGFLVKKCACDARAPAAFLVGSKHIYFLTHQFSGSITKHSFCAWVLSKTISPPAAAIMMPSDE
jgi:hypothetical protein